MHWRARWAKRVGKYMNPTLHKNNLYFALWSIYKINTYCSQFFPLPSQTSWIVWSMNKSGPAFCSFSERKRLLMSLWCESSSANENCVVTVCLLDLTASQASYCRYFTSRIYGSLELGCGVLEPRCGALKPGALEPWGAQTVILYT